MKKLLLLALVALGGVMNASAQDTWVIAGDNASIFGNSWNGSDLQNALVQSNGNVYVLTKNIAVNENTEIKFKAVKNGNTWYNFAGVAGGSNNDAYFIVPSGSTKISFVFDISSQKGFVFTDKTNLSLKGTFWGWDVDHVLAPTDNYGVFSYSENDFLATGGTTYEYRVWINYGTTYNMDTNFPISVTDNQSYGLNESQKYDLTFNINLLENTVSLGTKRVVELGTSGMGTFSSKDAYNFTGIEGLSVYYISELTATSAKLTSISDVPSYNGVLLVGTAGGRYAVPFGGATGSISGNKLWAAPDGYTVENDGDAYILSNGEFHPAKAGNIPAGKAYIPGNLIPSSGGARSLSLMFDDATGIGTMQTTSVEDNVFYNLGGQRVAAPTKGMYIVNGKKVIIK